MAFKRKVINRYKVTVSWEVIGRLTYENNSDNLTAREIAEELRKIAATIDTCCDKVESRHPATPPEGPRR